MDRASVERLVREGYAARLRGDVEETCRHFAEDADFTIAGRSDVSPVACSVEGCGAVRDALSGLIDAVEFLRHDFKGIVIEGDRAAVHSHVRLRARGTEEEVETEFLDLITVRDGKIASFRQFCDTALAARVLGGAAPPR